jgi:hypothetical protein
MSPPRTPPVRLLQRLDALADLAHATGIEPGHGGGVELLLLLGIAVGILRADGRRG